jgi:3-methyl-2-oxobutanoate hydroxymethyltransferase
VLVMTDATGMSDWTPPFAEAFGNVREEMSNAIADYADAVEDGQFPTEEHSHVSEELEDIY